MTISSKKKIKWKRFYETSLRIRFGILELRNRVTQNDVTLRVTNSKSKNKEVSLPVTNSKSKNKKFHFELLTRSRKIKSYTSSY